MGPPVATSGEVVVVIESMGLDELVTDTRVVGERREDDRLVSDGTPSLVEHVSDGLGTERATLVRVTDGYVERDRAVLVEQAEETRGRTSEMTAVERDFPEERLRGRTDGKEAILSSMLPRLTFFGGERHEVALVLDLLTCIVRANVARDLDGAIEHAHLGLGRDESEGLAHKRVRNRVIISVEADVGGLSRGDGSYEVGRSGVLRQRKKASTLDDERVANETTIGIGGDLAPTLHAVDPRVELGIEVIDGVERSCSKEGFAKIAHASLDAALLIASRHGAGLWREVVVTGEVEDAGMESNEIPLALEDGALEVVVQDRTRDSPKRDKCGEVSPEEALGGLVEVEAGEERAAPRQDHEEAGEGALGATDQDRAERGPVHLGLLSRQDRETEERLVVRGTQARDKATYRKAPAAVATITEHLEEPCCAQARMPLNRRADEVAIGIEHLRAYAKRGDQERPTLDRAMDRIVVKAQLGGDGADLPVLGEKQSADLGALLVRDHRATSSMRSFRRSSNFPMPVMSRRRART